MKIPKDIKERSKNRKCSVEDCCRPSVRTVFSKEYGGSLRLNDLKFEETRNKMLNLCKHHYSIVKKRYENKNINKKGFLFNESNPKFNNHKSII